MTQRIFFILFFVWFHTVTKVKFYPYICAVFFQFVFIILIFLVFTSPVNRLNLLIFC